MVCDSSLDVAFRLQNTSSCEWAHYLYDIMLLYKMYLIIESIPVLYSASVTLN